MMNIMNPNMDNNMVVNNLTEFETFNRGVHDFLATLSTNINEGYSHDHHHHHHPQRPHLQIPFCFSSIDSVSVNPNYYLHYQVPAPAAELNFDSLGNCFPQGAGGVPASHGCNNSNVILSSESDGLANSSSGFLLKNKANGGYNYGGKKRKRSNDRDQVLNPKEVVHVRAKRGQATDSHSLAERLRREKINEKLRCLQDLVPGCYKTMGMAVMLDVIINYVRSLQNQIDFLSMKLSAASLYYDFNSSSDMEAMGTTLGMQQQQNGFEEAQGMEKMMGEGYGVLPQSHSSWPL